MSEEIPELEELEPLEEATAAPAAPGTDMAAAMQAMHVGLPTPAFNPRADKEYYRFLFAGIIMFLGCLMPFGPEWTMAGYKTLSGAVFMLIAIGTIWSWWAAIYQNRFSMANLKWVVLALIPFIVELFNLINAFDAPAVQAANLQIQSWGELFTAMKNSTMLGTGDPAAGMQVDNFFRAFGTGKLVVFFGALLSEVFFLMAIFGGAKAAKDKKLAARQASAERRTRR